MPEGGALSPRHLTAMSAVDWEPFVRRLCPTLFDPITEQKRPSVRLMLVTLSHMNYDVLFGKYVGNTVSFTPTATASKDSVNVSLMDQMDSPKIAQSPNLLFDYNYNSFGISLYGVAEMHVSQVFPSLTDVTLPEYESEAAPSSSSNQCPAEDELYDCMAPQLQTRTLTTRGTPTRILVNALQTTPWSTLPFMSPLVEYLIVTSDAGDCMGASEGQSTFFRNYVMQSFVRHHSKKHNSGIIQCVAHAWLAARVLSPSLDTRAPWSVYRNLGAVIKQMQHAKYCSMTSESAEYIFNNLQQRLLEVYRNIRYPNETNISMMLRINWAASVQAMLISFTKGIVKGSDLPAFANAIRAICAPISWGTQLLQMEVHPQHAKLGWKWGVLLMGLGCSNITPVGTNMLPHTAMQWGDALHGDARQLAVIHALCDCPELLYHRNTINSLLLWAWRRNWSTPCNSSPARASVSDTLCHLRPAMNTILHALTFDISYTSYVCHAQVWSEFMAVFYGKCVVPMSDDRRQLYDTLTQFRLHCEKQWMVMCAHGILPAPNPYIEQQDSSSSTTQPLALSVGTHAGRTQWLRRPGRVGLWFTLYPRGTNGTFPQYAYHATGTAVTNKKKAVMQAADTLRDNQDSELAMTMYLNPVHHAFLPDGFRNQLTLSGKYIDWSNGCSMAPLMRMDYPGAKSVPAYYLQKVPHEYASLTDLQQWLLLWYCARTMTRNVRLPYDVHHGPMTSKLFWPRVCGTLQSGFHPALNVAVVPTRDLVHCTTTRISPWSAVDVASLQDYLLMHHYNTPWTVVSLVILYAHWWTLDHWRLLMQAIDMACTTQRQRSPSSSPEQMRNGALPRIAVRLHIFGIMWLGSMEHSVHHAIWPQLYYSKHANLFHFGVDQPLLDPLASDSPPPLYPTTVGVAPRTASTLESLFSTSYATRTSFGWEKMPWTAANMHQRVLEFFHHMQWRQDATQVTAYMHPQRYSTRPTVSVSNLPCRDNYFTSSSIVAVPVETSDDEDGLIIDDDDDEGDSLPASSTNTASQFGRLLEHNSFASVLGDTIIARGIVGHEYPRVTDDGDGTGDMSHTLEPETLLLLPYPLHANIHLSVLRDHYPRQHELTTVRQAVEDGITPLRLRMWLRRVGIHIILTHQRSVPIAQMNNCTPVCWCHTPYARQFVCGELYMDNTLPLHQTAAVLETQDGWKCPGTDMLYCSVLPYGKNGQYHYADTTKTRRTLVWMRLVDPIPLFDAVSLTHYAQLIATNRGGRLVNLSTDTLRCNMLLPTAVDYTSMRARHVVLYIMGKTSMQSVWSAMQLARESFSMVGIDTTNGRATLIADNITHCRPLQPPLDGLWLDFAINHALKKRAMHQRTSNRTSDTNSDDIPLELVQKRKSRSNSVMDECSDEDDDVATLGVLRSAQ